MWLNVTSGVEKKEGERQENLEIVLHVGWLTGTR
jgi:hypothetical protein